MRLSSVYLYVSDMAAEAKFWTSLLQMEPVTSSGKWTEFSAEGVKIGLLWDEDLNEPVNSTSVLVLEVEDKEVDEYIARAQSAGGSIVIEGLANRILMASPSGHKFEIAVLQPAHSAA
jgi:predicted enzyme related to lactoylglutathione lyase